MCDFTGRLVAWMDGELRRERSRSCAAARSGLRGMPGARRRVRGSEPRIRRLLRRHAGDERRQTKTRRKLPRWVPVVTGAAAAVAALCCCWRCCRAPLSRFRWFRKWQSLSPPATEEPVVTKPLQQVQPVQRRHVAARRKAPSRELGDG